VYNKAELSWYSWNKLPNFAFRDLAIVNASKLGNVELVNLLLKCQPGKKLLNESLIIAIKHYHTKIVKILLKNPNTNPEKNNNESLILAIKTQQTELVRILLEDSNINPGINNNISLYKAIDGENVAIVKILLQHPQIDPIVNKSDILRYALEKRKEDMIVTLLDDDRILEKVYEYGFIRDAVQECMSGSDGFAFRVLTENERVRKIKKSSTKSLHCILF
jgi:hypothetical protein